MTNEEFKELCDMKKHFIDENIHLPAAGNKLDKSIPVYSDSTKDVFTLDIDRRGITLTKKKLQERHGNTNTVMIRLEIDCRPHMFSDGHKSSRNHIHVFDEQDDKTFDIDEKYANIFSDTDDFVTLFFDFCRMCNIKTDGINIQGVI